MEVSESVSFPPASDLDNLLFSAGEAREFSQCTALRFLSPVREVGAFAHEVPSNWFSLNSCSLVFVLAEKIKQI